MPYVAHRQFTEPVRMWRHPMDTGLRVEHCTFTNGLTLCDVSDYGRFIFKIDPAMICYNVFGAFTLTSADVFPLLSSAD